MEYINVVCRYDEIRTMQVNHLLSALSSGNGETSGTIHKSLDERIQRYAAGESKHAREAISLIWRSSLKPRDIDISSVPPNAARPSGDPETVQRRRRVRTLLINSIQGKSFLHRRYWARTSQGGRICPVYLPDAVSNSVFPQVAACKWGYIQGSTSVLNSSVVESLSTHAGYLEMNEEHELSDDSDYESENEVQGDPVAGDAGDDRGEQKLLPVLKVGSLAA